MRILHICRHKRSIPSLAIFRPAIYGALRSRSVSHCESDPITYAIENIGLIISKRPLKVKTVNLTELATAFPGRAQSDSHYRRLQRFFQHIEIKPALIAQLVVSFLPYTVSPFNMSSHCY